MRPAERRPDFGIALGRPEPHDDVGGLKYGFEPRPKQDRKVERRQSALAHNHGMNEFYRYVLGIGGIGAAPEGQQAASAEKAFGHVAARFGQTRRLAREKPLEQLVSFEQPLFHLTGEFTCGCHTWVGSTDSWQRIADQHIYDSAAPVKGCHQNRAGRLFPNFSDDLRLRFRRVPGSER